MKRLVTLLASIAALGWSASAQTLVVPSSYANTYGGQNYASLFRAGAASLQLSIEQTLLTDLVGQQLTGISFRIPASANSWPASTTTYANYDVYISSGVTPASFSYTNWATNSTSTPKLVRSGSLTIPPNAFMPTSAATWGPVISFDSIYVYNGGHLTIELRHSNATPGSTTFNDAINSTVTGYNTQFKAASNPNNPPVSGEYGYAAFVIPRLSYSQPLAVKLTGFTASTNGADATLSWTAINDKDFDHFELERSQDGSRYQMLSVIPQAVSGKVQPYHYTDHAAAATGASVLYYRLKLVEKNGSFEFSKTASVRLSGKAQMVALYPNPAMDKINASVFSDRNGTAVMRVLNMAGAEVARKSFLLTNGASVLEMPLAGLPTGMYLAEISGPWGREIKNFVQL